MTNSITKEYKNLLNQKREIDAALQALPHGYISQKKIKGKTYYYLQCRESGKLISRYIKSSEVDNITKQIALRKEFEAELPQIANRLNELEQAARLVNKSISRELMLQKISVGMDSIDAAKKERSASFANAMNAIEGIPISKQTEQDIAEWHKGSKSFISVFESTLKRYGFSEEV